MAHGSGLRRLAVAARARFPCTISTRLTARPLPSQRTQNSPVVGRVRAVLITSRSRSLKFGSIGSPRTLRILKSPGFAPPSWRSIASGRYHRALSRGTWRRRRRQAPGLRRPGCRTADGADRGTDAGYRDAYGAGRRALTPRAAGCRSCHNCAPVRPIRRSLRSRRQEPTGVCWTECMLFVTASIPLKILEFRAHSMTMRTRRQQLDSLMYALCHLPEPAQRPLKPPTKGLQS